MAEEKLNQFETSIASGSRIEEKKPYEAPRILTREVIEAVAAACRTASVGKAEIESCVVLNS